MAITLSIFVSACQMPTAPSPAVDLMNEASSSSAFSAEMQPQALRPLATVTSTLTIPQDGWASVTGFRNAETPVQRAIVRNALAADGQSSGPSVLGDWETDAERGEGERMRNAINLLAASMAAQPSADIPPRVQEQMKAFLSTNDPRQQRILTDRMVERFRFVSRLRGPRQFPIRDDGQLLSFMGFNRQRLEWVRTVAVASGGSQIRWLLPGVPLFAPRPGMGVFDSDATAIIVDIDWRGGVPARFKIAEANRGRDWMNPNGQIPWQRTVTTRIVPAGSRIVTFE